MYGMSESVGLMHCASPQPQFLASDGGSNLDCSDETAREVDKEVKRILAESYQAAKTILKDHRNQLETITGELQKHESIDRTTFERLVEQTNQTETPVEAVTSC